MNIQFANFRMNKIIIHQIFERSDDREVIEPKYNSELTHLDRDGLCALQERIITALGNNSHSIEMNVYNHAEGSTYQTLTKMLDDSTDVFIANSKQLARRLAEAQTSRKIPGGILVIFGGVIGPQSQRVIGVIKAEIHAGFTIDVTSTSMVLKFLSDLLLTPQQKLYKIGMLIETSSSAQPAELRQPGDFKVFIYDQNMTSAETSKAALYFYDSFLGCSIAPTNKKLTQDFYVHTKKYIDSMTVPDEDKVELNMALHSYVKTSLSNTISVSDFTDQYIQLEFRDEYNNYMESNKFPSSAIIKDIEFIKNKLKTRKLKFSSNISISGPSENFTDLIEILGYEDRKTTIKIEGRIMEQG